MAIQSNNGLGSQGPKILYKRKMMMRDMVKLSFSFLTNGSSNPTGLKGRGVASVVHTSTGVYTVTLQDYYGKCVAGFARLLLGTVTKQRAMLVGLPVVKGGLTFTVETLDTNSGAAVDVAAATGNEVHVRLHLFNGSFGV